MARLAFSDLGFTNFPTDPKLVGQNFDYPARHGLQYLLEASKETHLGRDVSSLSGGPVHMATPSIDLSDTFLRSKYEGF